MSKIRLNIVANFAGSFWSALMSLMFIPIYLYFLGVEAYGLVAIFATLLASFAVLDMGLTQTLIREMARLTVLPDSAEEMRDLLRTLEIPYWGIGLVIGLVIVSIAPWLAENWFNNQSLPNQSVQTAVLLMGLMIAIQWPMGFYSGGLLGLQEQVILNVINSSMALARGLGTVIVLWLLSPTVEAFFWSQLVASVLHILLIAGALWRHMPHGVGRPRFRPALLLDIWQFAAGVMGVSLIGSMLLQLDKIVLSKMLSLEVFGFYAIANIVSMNVYRLFGPIYNAVYPRLTNLVSIGLEDELVSFYHKSAQLVSAAVFPVVAILVFFSQEALLIWLQNPEVAGASAPLVSILVLGTALNGVMHIPYGLQLANGWTSLAFRFGIFTLIAFAFLLWKLTTLYGVLGAAMAWLAVNVLYVVLDVAIMHRRLLPNELWRWYLGDVSVPLLLAFLPVAVAWLIKPVGLSTSLTLLYLFATYAFALLITVAGLPLVRQALLNYWRQRLLLA